MPNNFRTVRKSLNKAYLKVKPLRAEIDGFRAKLQELIERSGRDESEEHHKNNLREFLRDVYYGDAHYINTIQPNIRSLRPSFA